MPKTCDSVVFTRDDNYVIGVLVGGVTRAVGAFKCRYRGNSSGRNRQ